MNALYHHLKQVQWLRATYYNMLRAKCRIGDYVYAVIHLPIARYRYRLNLARVRRAFFQRKLRVVFPLSNISKWKEQSIYDLMVNGDVYDPIVALTPMDIETELSSDEQRAVIDRNKEILRKHGCEVVEAYVPEEGRFIPFRDLHPDIVWYTQPWRIDKTQDVYEVSKFALTCYTPYYVENYGGLSMACDPFFHRCLWRHFALSEAWATVFMKHQGLLRAGKVCGFGHPMLDQYWLTRDDEPEKKYVIYAPHFSCGIFECYSTFLKNGLKILELAKKHSEIQWVFKPHPTLRLTLTRDCGWSKEEVDAYYSEWDRIAVSCYDQDYIKLFKSSKAMITDCGSFLVEYACSKNPIIHLISSEAKFKPHPIVQKLFSSYYAAHNWEEFEKWFKLVILEGNDVKREERLHEVAKMRLLDNYAAEDTLKYLDGVLRGRE